MLIAFQRTVGTVSVCMIIDKDGDWDDLKKAMCDQWLVETPFNRHRVWERLRRTEIVILGNEIFQVWNTRTQGEASDELFQGHYTEVIMEDRP
jgi:hypothetical protein